MVVISTLPSIVIDLEPGMYMYDELSGIGKTALTSIVRHMTSGASPTALVCGTAADVNRLDGSEFDLILVDRFDMWGTDELAWKLKGASERGVVLVDVKHCATVMTDLCKFCTIHSDGRNVVVNEIPD